MTKIVVQAKARGKTVKKSENEKVKSITCHKDHRKRLIELAQNAGVANLSPIQQVELFLFFAVPRVDVNPLAHRLLDRYGSFANIVDAEINDLKRIHGVGDKVAMKIKCFGQLRDLYFISKLNSKFNIKNQAEFLNLLKNLMRFKSTENLFLFALSIRSEIIGQRRYDLQQVRKVGLPVLDICGFVASTNPTSIIVVHNHPGGTANPSDDDCQANEYLSNFLESLNCKMQDSMIVGCDGIYSDAKGAFVRDYCAQNNIVNFINERK